MKREKTAICNLSVDTLKKKKEEKKKESGKEGERKEGRHTSEKLGGRKKIKNGINN